MHLHSQYNFLRLIVGETVSPLYVSKDDILEGFSVIDIRFNDRDDWEQLVPQPAVKAHLTTSEQLSSNVPWPVG